MTFKDFARRYQDSCRGLGAVGVKPLLKHLALLIIDTCHTVGKVHIPGLGIFMIRTRVARTIRNPVTKELMQIPESKTIAFRPDAKARRALARRSNK
jgi:nucleoid DNA-binding protein